MRGSYKHTSSRLKFKSVTIPMRYTNSSGATTSLYYISLISSTNQTRFVGTMMMQPSPARLSQTVPSKRRSTRQRISVPSHDSPGHKHVSATLSYRPGRACRLLNQFCNPSRLQGHDHLFFSLEEKGLPLVVFAKEKYIYLLLERVWHDRAQMSIASKECNCWGYGILMQISLKRPWDRLLFP